MPAARGCPQSSVGRVPAAATSAQEASSRAGSCRWASLTTPWTARSRNRAFSASSPSITTTVAGADAGGLAATPRQSPHPPWPEVIITTWSRSSRSKVMLLKSPRKTDSEPPANGEVGPSPSSPG